MVVAQQLGRVVPMHLRFLRQGQQATRCDLANVGGEDRQDRGTHQEGFFSIGTVGFGWMVLQFLRFP